MKDMIEKGETNENDIKIKSLLDHYNFSDDILIIFNILLYKLIKNQ